MSIQLFSTLALAALFVGCAPTDAATPGSNHVSVLLTDAPLSEATSLEVEFGRVVLTSEGDDPQRIVTVTDHAGTIDVLGLTNGLVETLGTVGLPDGTYHRVRLVVTRATLAFADEEHDVFVPSGAQAGLKIDIEPPLVVAGGVSREVLIDFDVQRAIVETPPGSGSYLLKPTALRALSEAGGIDGTVIDPAGTALEGVLVEVHSAAGLVTTTTTRDDGSFAFIALRQGTYDLEFAQGGYETRRIEHVPVVAAANHALGDVEMTPEAPSE